MKIRTIVLSGLALAGVAAAAPAIAQNAEARGAALVKQNCAGCHSLGAGASPNPAAPPMPEIARKYRAEDLEEAFAEGIMVSHQATDMPPFTFEPPQIAALTAYLKALRAAKP
ncbi:MAG: cytochrome c [Beijerinckiaceae bacterium]|nr:cytochrome c [Beijerinckiaceae bacterium]